MPWVHFTISMPHGKIGKGLPTLSFETNDHTGGGYEIDGLHPTSIATLLGQGPVSTKVKPAERLDLKANLNAKRPSLALVISNTKHLPHWEWSSSGGAGGSPLAPRSLLHGPRWEVDLLFYAYWSRQSSGASRIE